MEDQSIPTIDKSEYIQIYDDSTEDYIKNSLKMGTIAGALYNGCFFIIKENGSYFGELWQHGVIGDDFENYNFDQAMNKAIEWSNLSRR